MENIDIIFKLSNEGEAGYFLDVRIKNNGLQEFIHSQTGLIEKVIKESNVEDCKVISNLVIAFAQGLDRHGA